MAKLSEEALTILKEVENKRAKLSEEALTILKEVENKRAKMEAKIEKNERDFEEKIKVAQSQNIQTLSIFVAIMGIIFGFVSFSIAPELSFLERGILFSLFIFGMIILILINKKL